MNTIGDIITENNKFNTYKELKILIACGGTGGHIFPALGLLEVLKKKKKDTKVILATTKRQLDRNIVDVNKDCRLISFSLSPLSLNFAWRSFVSLMKLFKASFLAFFTLIRLEPDIVVGFGGYVSAPFLLGASILKIPTLIHEQNVVPGRANYILARFVDRIAVSFERSKDYFRLTNKTREKIVLTGNPTRADIKVLAKRDALRFFNLNEDRFTILVMGGSQGSHRINLIFLDTIAMIKEVKHVQAIHITGQNDYELIKSTYARLDMPFCVFSFLKEMNFAYNACDLVVSRAGAMTVTEINFFRLPAIFIPYPYAHQHQLENAKALSDRGAAVTILDKDLTAARLKEELLSLVDNHQRLMTMRERSGSLICPSGNENLFREVITLVEKK